ncbi:hypothetical protein [Lelliottia amnigena]|uniref:hypothetical protein n=1 Tax=Lelliottia amnigena TaxID=61646 RepID=UPI00293B92F6|nr:hypothetical protein [Lelliottia amnigena]
MARISYYNVFIQPVRGKEFHAGVTNDSVLRVVDGFLIFEHRDTHHKMGLSVSQIAIWRLEPEYLDATKNA